MADLINKRTARKTIENYFESLAPSHYYKMDLEKASAYLDAEIAELPTTTEAEIKASAIDEFAEKAIKIVYEANNRRRNPQPRDMVADIHYKLRDLAEQLKERE